MQWGYYALPAPNSLTYLGGVKIVNSSWNVAAP